MRCPLCAAEHADRTGDNLAIYDDGHEFCYAGHGLIKGNKEDFYSLTDFTYEYLPHRGLTKRILEWYNIKTKIDADGKPICDGFKYPNDEYKIRDWEKKDFRTTPGKPPIGLFGRDKFSAGSHKYVTITEGEYDAPSLAECLWSSDAAGPPPVVSVQSSGTAARDCAVERSWLNSYERIYLCFDADAAGRRAVEEVARLFDYNKVFVVKLTRHKDANDYVQAGEGDELRRIWWNSKQYLPDKILTDFSDFEREITKPKKLGIPYPFKQLTEMTYGIRTGETVLVTAQEKVGKTELMHQILHQLLEKTDDPIGAIFLEEPPQRLLQAIAGVELHVPAHLPDAGVTDDQVMAACKKVIRRDGRLHVYSHFGSDDPVVFLDTIRFLATVRGCRYILLDHVSMVVSGSTGHGDERKLLDYFSTRLEMMVKELDFSLIMVSHVNDEGKTRGSRYLTKVSDITINIHRDLMSSNPVERNTTHISIPYNRFCGRTGQAGKVVYNPDRVEFTELPDDSNELRQSEQTLQRTQSTGADQRLGVF